MPVSPAASNREPIEAAWPTHLMRSSTWYKLEQKKRNLQIHVSILPCSYWWLHVLHCIVDRHTSCNAPTRRIYIHVNWFCATFRLNPLHIRNKKFKKFKQIITKNPCNHFTSVHTWRNSNWATISELILSLIPPIRQIIRSFNNLEKMSYDRSPRPVCSTTIGTRPSKSWRDVCIFRLIRTFWKLGVNDKQNTQLVHSK